MQSGSVKRIMGMALAAAMVFQTFAPAVLAENSETYTAVNSEATVSAGNPVAVQTGESAATPETGNQEDNSDIPADAVFTVTIDANGGTLPAEWIETANGIHAGLNLQNDAGSIDVVENDGKLIVTVQGKDSLCLMNPTPASDDEYFVGWEGNGCDRIDKESNSIVFDSSVTEYSLEAAYAPISEESELISNARAYTNMEDSQQIAAYTVSPDDPYTYLDLVVEGLEYVYEDGQIQTFTAPYDGDYVITAYGANGGTGYAKYDGYGVPGRGGMTEATVSLKEGQTIYLYLGEAGGDWSTERTFGGGGAGVDADHAWVGTDDGSLHIFGRGGGATYVSIDEYDLANAGQAPQDFTAEQQAQNDAAAEEAKKHVIMLAAGGGGAGEMGSPYSHYGLNGGGYEGGILRSKNQYYLPYEQIGMLTYDATIGGRTLTREERIGAWLWPATQTRAGYGYHYSINGELYDPNPANKDPIEYLYPEREARNWGSFFFGSNAMACTGAGGGGWFGGGTDYAMDGGGGSSYIGTSLTNADGSEMTIENAQTVAGGNVKYDNTKPTPFEVNGRVIIRLDGVTPDLQVNLQEAATEEGSKDHIDPDDIYGQKVKLNKGEDVASETVTYTAIIYYSMPDIMTVTPNWNYSTYVKRTKSPWNDETAKSIDSRLEVNFENTDLGILEPGDKYYNEKYPGWAAIKSVMTITNPVNSMYDTSGPTKYYFSCTGSATYTMNSGIYTLEETSVEGGLTIDYDIFLNHNGVHVYENRNIINGQEAVSFDDTVQATKESEFSTWEYPELELIDVNNINTVLVQFSSYDFDSRDTIHYDSALADQLGISGSGNQYTYVFRAKTENSVSTDTWEQFLRSMKFDTYDAAEFKDDGISGGVSIFWYADELLWDNDMFYDSNTGHFYAHYMSPHPYQTAVTWDESRELARSKYNSALDCYGYLTHITSAEEQEFVSKLMTGARGWLGARRGIGTNPWDWYWVDGPESETTEPFFRQNANGSYGKLLWGYENWQNKTEPNNAGNEYVMHYYEDTGEWNDYNPANDAVNSYIVEWSNEGLTGNHAVTDTDIIGTQVERTEAYEKEFQTVTGVVWAENDFNGIYKFGEEPVVEGTVVSLVNTDGKTIKTGKTNQSGQYAFYGVPVGEYSVKFEIPDKTIPGSYTSTLKVTGNGTGITNSVNADYQSDVMSLTADEPLSVNCGIYIPNSISGFVWDDTSHDGIYDKGEKKVQGLKVEIQQSGKVVNDSQGNPLQTVTNKDGKYRFADVPAQLSAYDIVITSGDDVKIENATVSPIPDASVSPENANVASAVTFGDVTVGVKLQQAVISNIFIPSLGNDFLGTDVQYQNCALYVRNSINGYVWAETDMNGVCDGFVAGNPDQTTEQLLSNMEVQLKDKDGTLITKTYTGKTGYYEFADVVPGDYVIEFTKADGFTAGGKLTGNETGLDPFLETLVVESNESQIGNSTTGVYDEGHLMKLVSSDINVKTVPVQDAVADAYVTNVNAGVFAPSSVSGRVWQDYDQDGIQGENEDSLSGVKVSLLKYTGTDTNSESSYTPVKINGKDVNIQTGQKIDTITGEIESSETGTYEFENLPTGTYAVKFESGDCDISYYIVSVKDASEDTVDNDAVGTYSDEDELISAFIGNISIPSQRNMDAYGYNNSHNDLGIYQKIRDVIVTKQIHADEIEWEHGTPTFTVKVYGTDQMGVLHEFNHVYEFTSDYVEKNTDENGIVSMTYTFEGIPYARIYNVIEHDTSRYVLEQLSGSDNATFEDEVASLDLRYDVSGEVTFLNKVSHYRDTSANSLVINSLVTGK